MDKVIIETDSEDYANYVNWKNTKPVAILESRELSCSTRHLTIYCRLIEETEAMAFISKSICAIEAMNIDLKAENMELRRQIANSEYSKKKWYQF